MGKLKKISGNSVGEMWNFTQIFPTFSLSHKAVPAPKLVRPFCHFFRSDLFNCDGNEMHSHVSHVVPDAVMKLRFRLTA